MKGKVIAHNQIQNLCSKITNVSDNFKILGNTNERPTIELTVVKNVNNILANRNEKYGLYNNFEISWISNQISNQDLEKNIRKI